MALMDCRAIWWLELLRKTTRTENHGSRMEAVLSYPRRVHHGKTTSVNPVAPCGRGCIGGLRPPSSRTPMLCIGYGCGASRPGEGLRSIDRKRPLIRRERSSRHLLPQGEKGREV